MSELIHTDLEQYREEARQRWGATEAYAEYAQKSKGCSKGEQTAVLEGMESIFAEFALCMNQGHTPESDAAQAVAAKLQAYITAHFYHCTNSIFAGLGQMYVADERFKQNIDRHGVGTAEFASKAIQIYCNC